MSHHPLPTLPCQPWLPGSRVPGTEAGTSIGGVCVPGGGLRQCFHTHSRMSICQLWNAGEPEGQPGFSCQRPPSHAQAPFWALRVTRGRHHSCQGLPEEASGCWPPLCGPDSEGNRESTGRNLPFPSPGTPATTILGGGSGPQLGHLFSAFRHPAQGSAISKCP